MEPDGEPGTRLQANGFALLRAASMRDLLRRHGLADAPAA